VPLWTRIKTDGDVEQVRTAMGDLLSKLNSAPDASA
jgi:hypothetical protein